MLKHNVKVVQLFCLQGLQDTPTQNYIRIKKHPQTHSTHELKLKLNYF